MTRRTVSLRLKLTLWYLLVFAGIQLALFTLAMLVTAASVDERHRAVIADAAGTMVDNILVAEYDWSSEALPSLVPRDLPLAFFVIRDAEGNGVAATPGLDLADVRFGENEEVPVGPLQARFADIVDPRTGPGAGDELVLVTLPFTHPEGTFFLQVAVPGATWRDALEAFRDEFLLGLTIGLVAAGAAAWVISGRAVAPLLRISAAAQDVSIEKLGEPIQVDARDEEVRHLEGELNRALGRIEAGYRSHERFMEAVSHELNTPVAVLLTEAQTLRGLSLAPDEVEGFRGSVEEEMRRLQTLVRSLLSLSKADFVQEHDAVPLDEVVLGAVEHCEPLARGRGVRLSVRAPEDDATDDATDDAPGGANGRELSGDRWLLATMLENLLRNAIRVSPPDEAVEVAWSARGDGLEVSVRDRGPGIPDEYLERVFDPFVQVPRDAQRLGGTGLGLSIARRIAEVHDGTIDVENGADGGCAFTVRLGGPSSPSA